jgi:hypothetical protein
VAPVAGSVSVNFASRRCTVTSLTNGNSYNFTIVAVNSVGSSAGASVGPVTPRELYLPSSNDISLIALGSYRHDPRPCTKLDCYTIRLSDCDELGLSCF